MSKILPLPLQKRIILSQFKNFNPDAEPDNLDWDCMDSTCRWSENFDNMAKGNPQFAWKDELAELEAEEHERQMNILHEAGIEDTDVMEKVLEIYGDIRDFTAQTLDQIAKQQERGVGEVFSKVVEVTPTTRKKKEGNYDYSKIQFVIKHRKFLGFKAKITVYQTDNP